uniref:Uncharacterized protein n=1 Tax=Rhizophora mucronata TaxID=61149 RepID=A0A2P2Q676_RHIMU
MVCETKLTSYHQLTVDNCLLLQFFVRLHFLLRNRKFSSKIISEEGPRSFHNHITCRFNHLLSTSSQFRTLPITIRIRSSK